MRTRHLPLIATGLLIATAATATPVSRDTLALQPQSRLWVEGTSTTRDFSCKAGVLNVTAEAGPGAAATIARGEKSVTAVRLDVPSGKLDCNNGTMNNHMYKALKVDQHPTIVFDLASYDLNSGAEGTLVNMKGTLTLGGVQKNIAMTARAVDEGQGMLRVSGTHDLRMTDYGIKPPSLMLGTMKVGERVRVNFDLLLKN